jgi:hypothetical protein
MNNIAIHSVPRSGSTWLGSIFDSSPSTSYRFQPLFSHQFKDFLTPLSSEQAIDSFFDKIHKTNDDFILQKNGKKQGLVPDFEKKEITHVVYKEVRYHNILENLLETSSEIKVIGLIRNPFATVNSWLRAPKEFRNDFGWKADEEWRYAPLKNLKKPEEFNGYEKWKEVTFLCLKLKEKFPSRFYLLNYDRLNQNTESVIMELFDFCDLPFTSQTKQFLIESTSRKSVGEYSVFKKKGEDTSWESELPIYIQKEIKSDPEFIELNKHFIWI